MSRRDVDRLEDVVAAIAAINSHMSQGDLGNGLVFDAVRMRLLEIGEAVRVLPEDVTAGERQIPWRDVAGLRDRLAHRYFDTDHAIVQDTVLHDLPDLEAAVHRLLSRLKLSS